MNHVIFVFYPRLFYFILKNACPLVPMTSHRVSGSSVWKHWLWSMFLKAWRHTHHLYQTHQVALVKGIDFWYPWENYWICWKWLLGFCILIKSLGDSYAHWGLGTTGLVACRVPEQGFPALICGAQEDDARNTSATLGKYLHGCPSWSV